VPSEKSISFRDRELSGSRLRCLILTSLPKRQVAECLSELISPWGEVDATRHVWFPKGLRAPDEIQLTYSNGLIEEALGSSLSKWWLEVATRANTPNWDLASTCTIGDKEGILLVEAKAHSDELSEDGKGPPKTPNGHRNHIRIGDAIGEACEGLNAISGGWALSRDSHYQLCNRFAWSWRLAVEGVPVVLVYLGFLGADEMRRPWHDARAWRTEVLDYSRGIVPEDAWENQINVGTSSIVPLIRSVDFAASVFA